MIRVGVIGFGLAGRVFHAPLVSSVEGLELAAVVERSTDHAAERYPGITIYRSVEELLADASIKLVVVATPNASHFAIAMQILEAAKNVVVDKPVALSSDEIRQLSEFAGGLGLQVFPFHNRRFDNDFQTLRKVMDEHQLGRLVHFDSNFDRWRPGLTRRPWKEDLDQGGLLFDIGTHLVDQTLVIFGLPASVSAEVGSETVPTNATAATAKRQRTLWPLWVGGIKPAIAWFLKPLSPHFRAEAQTAASYRFK